MGKILQSDKLFILAHTATLNKKQQQQRDASPAPDAPPQIPPRMKKKGPALPEKPPHMRAKSSSSSSSNGPIALSSQPLTVREPLKPRILNLDRPPGGGGSGSSPTQREVLVAASKNGRERPVEKRQREPAKLLKPTTLSDSKKDLPSIVHHLDDSSFTKKDSAALQSKALLRLDEILPSKRDLSRNPLWSSSLEDQKKSDPKSSLVVRKSRPLQPVLLIPRNLLTWSGSSSAAPPLSYAALWSQRGDVGRAKPRQGLALLQQVRQSETSGTSAVRLRSNSVTRSGSLTSQGSSGSDSGGETFPKSVLKKQRRTAANHSSSKGGTHSSNRKVDQKKNVTFNAFATVQLMEE